MKTFRRFRLCLFGFFGFVLLNSPGFAQEGGSVRGHQPLPQARAMIYANLSDPQPFVTFAVEVAATPDSMRKGLMYREMLNRDAGMLFVYPQDRRARFWMRNTLIPLDMLFIRKDGEIESIVERHDTQSDAASLSLGPVRYVLEINVGLSQRHGIKPGHFVRIDRGD